MDNSNVLLRAKDPQPVGEERLEAQSPFLLIADHAGNALPERLGDLGIADADLNRHIGIDIGIHGVSQRLSALLDAPISLSAIRASSSTATGRLSSDLDRAAERWNAGSSQPRSFRSGDEAARG